MNTNNQFESTTEESKIIDPYYDDVLPEINEEINRADLSLLRRPLHALIALLYIVVWFIFFQ